MSIEHSLSACPPLLLLASSFWELPLKAFHDMSQCCAPQPELVLETASVRPKVALRRGLQGLRLRSMCSLRGRARVTTCPGLLEVGGDVASLKGG